MQQFEKAYEIDLNNVNFENESYMNFCKDLVDFCNINGARIYKNSVSKETIEITKEETKEKVNARKYTCYLTIIAAKKIVKGKKVCDRLSQTVYLDNGIVRRRTGGE